MYFSYLFFRLCNDKRLAEEVVRLEGLVRLVELCKNESARVGSDGVLVACLAAVRKIAAAVGPEKFKNLDATELVEPRLLDSFLIFSSRNESFVWLIDYFFFGFSFSREKMRNKLLLFIKHNSLSNVLTFYHHHVLTIFHTMFLFWYYDNYPQMTENIRIFDTIPLLFSFYCFYQDMQISIRYHWRFEFQLPHSNLITTLAPIEKNNPLVVSDQNLAWSCQKLGPNLEKRYTKKPTKINVDFFESK